MTGSGELGVAGTLHSAGPWHVQVDQQKRGNGLCIVGNNHVSIIARVPLGGVCDERNAQVLAAGPELLAALIRLLAFTGLTIITIGGEGIDAHQAGCGCVAHEALAAIRKAGADMVRVGA